MQLTNVTRDKGEDGQVTAGSHGEFSWGSKRKKDVAYSLLYAHFAAYIIREETALKEQDGEVTSSGQEVPIVVTQFGQ